MIRRYFELDGLRYDMGTKLTVTLPDGEIKQTTYLGFGRFEGISPEVGEISVVKIDSPKYFVETYKKN